MKLNRTVPPLRLIEEGSHIGLYSDQTTARFDNVFVNGEQVHYFHNDHLGSTSLLSDESGNVVEGSTSYFYPFGGYRGDAPETNPDVTERGYTGHKENNYIKLLYANARFYAPYLNRFVSADTIIPDPTNPQSYNRYSYVLNNPLKFTDPSGHCAEPTPANDPSEAELNADIYECQRIRGEIYDSYDVSATGVWKLSEIQALWRALQDITLGFGGKQYVKALMGGTNVIRHQGEKYSDIPGEVAHVRSPSKMRVFDATFSRGFESSVFMLIHEFGHILDARTWTRTSAKFEEYTGGSSDGCIIELLDNCTYTAGDITVSSKSFDGRREDFAESFAVYMYQGNLDEVKFHGLSVSSNNDPSIQLRMRFIQNYVDEFVCFQDYVYNDWGRDPC